MIIAYSIISAENIKQIQFNTFCEQSGFYNSRFYFMTTPLRRCASRRLTYIVIKLSLQSRNTAVIPRSSPLLKLSILMTVH